MNFKKKPVVIEAFCLGGGLMPDWFLDARSANTVRTYSEGTGNPFNDPLTHAEIDTLEGTHRANRGDWIIRGIKGELYPCKPDIFAATYEPASTVAPSGLDFGDALRALKAGKRIARAGWNGKDMWLALSGPLEGRRIPAASFWSPRNAEYAAQTIDGSANVLPCITMKTADGSILMGWLASQTDMLAEDWVVLG